MPRTALALATAIIAIASPAHAGFWENYYAACPSCLTGGFDPGPTRVACGQMGLGSNGLCREGIFGAIDQSAHGACTIDPRTMATRCER